MSAESVAASRCERHPPPDRDYQAAGIRQAYVALKRMAHPRRRLLLVAATGAGKTHIACRMAYDCYRHRRVLFIVDRDKLVDQTLASFRASLPCEVAAIKAGHPENRAAQVQVASRQTMQSRGWWRAWIREAPAVIFVDEAHDVDTLVRFRKITLGVVVPEGAFEQSPRPGLVPEHVACEPSPGR